MVLAYLPHAATADLHGEDEKARDEHFRAKLAFMRKFVEAVLAGVSHEEARFFADHVVNSYFECLYFVIAKRLQGVACGAAAMGQARAAVVALVRAPVLAFLQGAETSTAYAFVPYKQVAPSLAQFYGLCTASAIVAPAYREMLAHSVAEVRHLFAECALKVELCLANYCTLVDHLALKLTEQSLVFEAASALVWHCFQATVADLNGSLGGQFVSDVDLELRLIRNHCEIVARLNKHKERPIVKHSLMIDRGLIEI